MKLLFKKRESVTRRPDNGHTTTRLLKSPSPFFAHVTGYRRRRASSDDRRNLWRENNNKLSMCAREVFISMGKRFLRVVFTPRTQHETYDIIVYVGDEGKKGWNSGLFQTFTPSLVILFISSEHVAIVRSDLGRIRSTRVYLIVFKHTGFEKNTRVNTSQRTHPGSSWGNYKTVLKFFIFTLSFARIETIQW